ncbi:raffinose/stachyose/melibiose transport system permease protein [Planifilum fulgidum]|jgi:raffinose/stachyose/melibiose transport system permease protein|uniref:Raffinose/stachyose/melibiose transport system permease protein n=1 Tax=Planifilum fulgidum TaxID=201973 RepID=A0A1I2MEB5_9BACL|nr:sugar ABC transporter permease [Planifilum fulgidum]MBO2495982.1 sugar ABC transporter permease [Bacillota bacterium]MBO2531943.1 sugar ABC transporter permease [Thermoactinomycetaceae bacterium]SFF89835.1 raffinose/stachyose/melibiose transport system permease protein [Planifilum fulgidum]
MKKSSVILAFIGPALLVYCIFVLYPIFSTFYYSLFEWSGIESGATFAGLSNYLNILSDNVFWMSLENNLLLVVASLLTQLPLGLLLALLLFAPIRGVRLFRTVYFLPLLMSSVAVGILWIYIYEPNQGILNRTLDLIGLSFLKSSWLGSEETAFWAVVATICWQFTPFYMILFRAALVGIPEEIYESASIDGAGAWQKFRHITLPLLLPTIITSSILSIIGSLKYFDLIFVMTGGGPNNATELMATYMYKQAFSYFNMGYASTIAFVMFLIAFVVTVIVYSLGYFKRKGNEAV